MRCSFCEKHRRVAECLYCLNFVCDDEFCQGEHDMEQIELLSVSSRAVCYLGTDKIIKYGCPNQPATGGQNRIEATTWERVKDHPYADYLAPVLEAAPDGSWLIQKRINGRIPMRSEQNALAMLLTVAEEIGIDTLDIGGDNVMIDVNGNPVIIDYGFDRFLYEERDEDERCGTCTYCSQYAYLS